jgi:shikimate kinase
MAGALCGASGRSPPSAQPQPSTTTNASSTPKTQTDLRLSNATRDLSFRKLATRVSATIAGAAMEHDESTLSHAEIAALARRIDRPVVLVGLMGVGKSSIGRKLSNLLHMPFVDADDEIESAAQMSIAEIFAQFGEPYFRDGERRVIARLIDEPGTPRVIATGGGAFVNPDTRALILAKTIAVWLDSDLNVLVERVGRKDSRPLLKNGDPREILSRLKAEREPAYAQAPIHVMSSAGPQGQTVAQVLKGIAEWL